MRIIFYLLIFFICCLHQLAFYLYIYINTYIYILGYKNRKQKKKIPQKIKMISAGKALAPRGDQFFFVCLLVSQKNVGFHALVSTAQTLTKHELLMVHPHFGVVDDAGNHPVCTGFSRVCVVICTSTGACQTHNHGAMQVRATRQGASFCNCIWVAGHTYLCPSHTTWVPVKIVTPIFDKNPGQPSPGLFPPPMEMLLCKRAPRGRWCILLCTLSSNSLEKRATWQ